MYGKHDAQLYSIKCVIQGLVLSTPLSWPSSHFWVSCTPHLPPLQLLIRCQHLVPGGLLCLTSCVHTCLLILCSCVRKPYAHKEEVVKAVVVGLHSQGGQCSRVRWLDPCGRQFGLQQLLPAQLAQVLQQGYEPHLMDWFSGPRYV